MKYYLLLPFLIWFLAGCQDETEEQFKAGREAVENQDYESAEQIFTELIAEDDADYNAYNNRAIARYQQKKYNEALLDVNKALSLNDEDEDLYITRANIYYDMGDLEKAKVDLEKLITEGSKNPYVYYLFGSIKLNKKDFAGAEADLKKALELDPKHKESLTQLPVVYLLQGEHDKAIQILDDAIKLYPEPALYTNRGFAKLQQEKFDEALLDFDKAIYKDQYMAEAHSNRGFVLFKQGKEAEALEALDRSLKIMPENAYAFKYKGIIYEAQDKKDEACAAYRNAIKLGYSRIYGDDLNKKIETYCVN